MEDSNPEESYRHNSIMIRFPRILLMKMKRRKYIAGVCVIVACLLLFDLVAFDNLPAVSNVGNSWFGVGEGAAFLERDSQMREAPLVGGAHLLIPRKDLDKSNYSSDYNLSAEKERLLALGDSGLRPLQQPGSFAESQEEKENVPPTEVKKYKPDNVTVTKVAYLEETVRRVFGTNLERISDARANLNTWKLNFQMGPQLSIFKKYMKDYDNLTNWERYHVGIHQYALYDPTDPSIDALLHDMQTLEIVDMEEKPGGTQLKFIITYDDEGQSLFKPRRFARDYETPPDHFYFVDFERHNAEIAAFHLDRMLGFYRCPPVAGRTVNITRDFERFAPAKLKKTFFRSPAKNVCFHGTCSYYCDTTHAICGKPDQTEGSFASLLPSTKMVPRKTWRNPWRRSYSKHKFADWESDDSYCDAVKVSEIYGKGRRMMDLMDLTAFDFMIGNMDRHHYETLLPFGNETFMVHLDHGRSFGKPHFDEMSILTPIRQCCLFRYSTLVKFLVYHNGPLHLSDYMRKSTQNDPIYPIVTEPHLEALDRRVAIVLSMISDCVQKAKDIRDVVKDDKF